MPINKNEITKEMIEKAMKCETADELLALAKAEGYDITKDEAEAYFAELADVELDEDILNKAAVLGIYEVRCALIVILLIDVDADVRTNENGID